ncbi:MAG TPA: hypothetical protein VF590_27305, partial [Isosphaeraceae bacterium]
YPSWRDYPHVANFYGPGYFLLVGLLGRAAGAGLEGLFLIGRAVNFGAGVLTCLLLGWYAGRRHGAPGATIAAVLGLGAAPMVGYGEMVRPDLMAEALGFAGFLLVVRRGRAEQLAGGAGLVLAIFTKQTAGIFLLAGALALTLEGRRRAAGLVLGGGLLAAVVVLVGVTWWVEPGFAEGLLGDSRTPWDPGLRATLLASLGLVAPDLPFFTAVGLGLWGRGPTKDLRLLALAVVVTAAEVATAAKLGADLNYFLGSRLVAALAAASLWSAARAADARWRPRLAAVAACGALLLSWGAAFTGSQAQAMATRAQSLTTAGGRELLRTHGAIEQRAREPRFRLLTDSGLLDAHQFERTAFGDPYLFRVLVATAQVDPARMRSWIARAEYDLIVTRRDLRSPAYDAYQFGLPPPLAREARRRYCLVGERSGLFFYRPRGDRGPGLGVP